MWYYVEISKGVYEEIKKGFIAEKLTIEGQECYLIVIGRSFKMLEPDEMISIAKKIVNLYSQFTTFLAFDDVIIKNYDCRVLFKQLEDFLSEYSNPISYEKSVEFRESRKVVVDDFLKKYNTSKDFIIKSIKELNKPILEGLMDNNKLKTTKLNLVQETLLESIIRSKEFSFISFDSDELGNIPEDAEIFPTTEILGDFLEEFKKKTKRNIPLNAINLSPGKQLSILINNENFKREFPGYIDFLRYDFYSLYSDKTNKPIKLLKIFTNNFLLNFLNTKEGLILMATFERNEFSLNRINGNPDIADLKQHNLPVFKVDIKSNVLQPLSDRIAENYISQIMQNIGIAFPHVVNLGQRIFPGKKEKLKKVEVVFDDCSFIVKHTQNWNDSIFCNI